MASVPAATRDEPVAPAVSFLLTFARVGHDAGYGTGELEERLRALAASLRLPAVEVAVTPTVIEITVGPLAEQNTYTLRVSPAGIDLGTLARLDDLVRDVIDESVGPAAALARVERIEATPLTRPWPVMLGAYGLAGIALTPVLGGDWRDALAAGVVGVVVGAVALCIREEKRLEPVFAPVAGAAASFTADAIASIGFHVSPDVVTLASLVSFLPGMMLTAGVRELAARQLQSGVANTASALIQLLGLIYGVELGRSIAYSWFGPVQEVVPHPVLAVAPILAAAAAGLAFTIRLRARTQDALIMCSATVLALITNRLGAAVVGKQASVFLAAVAVGVVGGFLGYRLRRSPLVFLVPGVLMLVPGSASFVSALELLTKNAITGLTATLDTFVTAISIAYGLMVATVVLPRRFGEVAARRTGSPGR